MECVKLGERPPGLPKTVDRRTLEPCLSALYDQDTPFYGNELTFTRVYGGRCIEGTVYAVPEDGDGLYQFMSAEIQRRAFQSKDASEGSKELWELLESNQVQKNESPTMEMEMPQLFHASDKHKQELNDRNAVEVSGNCVRVFGGDQFFYVRIGSPVPPSTALRISKKTSNDQPVVGVARLRVKFAGVGQEILIESAPLNQPTITISSGYGLSNTFPAPDAFVQLLDPSTWLYRLTLECRREYAGDAFPRAEHDPLGLILLKCILASYLKAPNRFDLWAEALWIFSNNHFRSNADKCGKFELSACNEYTGIWGDDMGQAAYRSLCKRLQTDAVQLQHKPTLYALVKILNDEKHLEGLKILVHATAKQEEGALPPPKKPEDVTVDMLVKELKKICFQMATDAQLGVCKALDDYNTMKKFSELVHDQDYQYDDNAQINFSDGLCYDTAMKVIRRIRPSDGATVHMEYPAPVWDDSKDAALECFLGEVFPNRDVRNYWVSENSKCLHMMQTSPKVLLLFGCGGGGKGTLTRLSARGVGALRPQPRPCGVHQVKTGRRRWSDVGANDAER